MQQSWGLMVNYLYALKKLDRHRKMLREGKIPVSGEVSDLSL
jgi:malonyl-CoA decarboxylase